MTAPIPRITPIPRGQDLTDDDLRQIVDDFYEVRNWAALQMRMGVPDLKEHLFRALQVRLGRREQVGPTAPSRAADGDAAGATRPADGGTLA